MRGFTIGGPLRFRTLQSLCYVSVCGVSVDLRGKLRGGKRGVDTPKPGGTKMGRGSGGARSRNLYDSFHRWGYDAP